MKIGDVAKLSGLATSTLRYYEEIGLLPPAERQSGQRIYEEDVLIYLKIIQLAKQSGFSLDEIKVLLADADEANASHSLWNNLAERKLAEIDEIVASYQTMQKLLQHILDCQCLDIRECELILG